MFQADAKNLPKDVQKKMNRDAKSLIRKLKDEKMEREEKLKNIELNKLKKREKEAEEYKKQ